MIHDRNEYTLTVNGTNSLDYGIVVTEILPFFPIETKDLPKRDWPDEDGDDVFVPAVIPLKSYERTVSLCYTGDMKTAESSMSGFVEVLRRGFLSVSCGYHDTNFSGALFSGISDIDYHVGDVNGRRQDIVEFKVKFRVTLRG